MYSYSSLDKRNKKWFADDVTAASLHSIQLTIGTLRGLAPFYMRFEYPITVLAGENGSGKSTILAMAACAFHEKAGTRNVINRDKKYYTFSDFFVQASSDVAPGGIDILYGIMHNNWKNSEPGFGEQLRSKREGGRWTNYDRRVPRNVVYFGVNRVVPYYERVTHCSYRSKFRAAKTPSEIADSICEKASYILGKEYEAFTIYRHGKYRIPVVRRGGVTYSGFNMGAGENAIFDILLSAHEAGHAALLVIDEIELGLHAKAQKRFVEVLKQMSFDTHCQVICSTHSPDILETLPPEARYFIDSYDTSISVLPGVSAKYATGKLSGRNSAELAIFVEDGLAKELVASMLPHDLRARVLIVDIGSSEAVLRQLAANYREGRFDCLAMLDGDKRSQLASAKRKVYNYLEGTVDQRAFDAWISDRLQTLPGDSWPERWLIEKVLSTDLSAFAEDIGADKNIVKKVLEEAKTSRKHNEIYTIGKMLFIEKNIVISRLIHHVKITDIDVVNNVVDCISRLL